MFSWILKALIERPGPLWAKLKKINKPAMVDIIYHQVSLFIFSSILCLNICLKISACSIIISIHSKMTQKYNSSFIRVLGVGDYYFSIFTKLSMMRLFYDN